MDRLEAAFGSTDPLVIDLRDALTVTAEVEARQSLRNRQDSERLVSRDKQLAEHDNWPAEHQRVMKELDDLIAKLAAIPPRTGVQSGHGTARKRRPASRRKPS